MSSNSGDAWHSGPYGVPPGKETAFSRATTRRAWRRSRVLHHVRHLGPYALLAVVSGLFTAIGGPWRLVLVVVVSALAIAVPVHWWHCRHASVNARRARLVMEHYPWRPCLLEAGPGPDDHAQQVSVRKWQGAFFRLVEPDLAERVRVHGVPGPGWQNSSTRSPCDPRILGAFGADGVSEAWFAGDMRFGGVLSPVGGGQPVLTRAREGRGLRAEQKAAPPERDALAIRAGLLEYGELPKRHPLRRAHEGLAPARPVTGSWVGRGTAVRAAGRAVLALVGGAALLTGLFLLFVAVRPGGTEANVRVFVAMSAMLALAMSCRVGAGLADSESGGPLRWLGGLGAGFFWTAFVLFWLGLVLSS
ncbi:hypothetical protein ABZ915_00720 [Streptomyces sp. NPDC046915]|uniref:hypothetical protein n=1 Tax=Streptomyces sp. NPDC046915 TaxID=3155257 RepID=UPI0033CF5F39